MLRQSIYWLIDVIKNHQYHIIIIIIRRIRTRDRRSRSPTSWFVFPSAAEVSKMAARWIRRRENIGMTEEEDVEEEEDAEEEEDVEEVFCCTVGVMYWFRLLSYNYSLKTPNEPITCSKRILPQNELTISFCNGKYI